MLGLNTLLQKLNGSSADPLMLDAELAEIARQRTAIPGKRAELKKRRLEALRDDDDVQARKIEKDLVDLDRDEDRLADSALQISQRAITAHAAAGKRNDDAVILAYLEASAALAEKLEAADIAAMTQRRYWDQNQSALARLGIEPLGAVLILGDGFGVQWARRTRGIITEMRRRLSGQPEPPKSPPPLASSALGNRAPLPHQRARITDSKDLVSLADAAPGAHTAQRMPDDFAPLEVGQARVRVLRAGFSPADDRPQTHYGQILRMPIQAALRAEGAIEIVEYLTASEAATPDAPEVRP
jgi:hypothetical protein